MKGEIITMILDEIVRYAQRMKPSRRAGNFSAGWVFHAVP
jgi:hypothetical protein